MFVNKIGMEHFEMGRNCQDYGFEGEQQSIVCDGCSEGEHSEVGAKMFCFLVQKNAPIVAAFDRIVGFFGYRYSPKVLRDYVSFTTLQLLHGAESWIVNYCGDGYIILEDHDGNITFEELSDGEYPKYYIYNYIDPEYLNHYKDGVSFSQKTFSKEKYAKVGIASDGLRYILQADEELKNGFINGLKSGHEMRVKLFINRNHKIFRDDVTIVF